MTGKCENVENKPAGHQIFFFHVREGENVKKMGCYMFLLPLFSCCVICDAEGKERENRKGILLVSFLCNYHIFSFIGVSVFLIEKRKRKQI